MTDVPTGISLIEFYEVSSNKVISYILAVSSSKSKFDIMLMKILKLIIPQIIQPLIHDIIVSLKQMYSLGFV